MPTVDVECPECAMVLPIEEERLGEALKCPKCKFVFDAEKSGGAYEIVDPRSRASRGPASGPIPEVEPPPETDAERKIRERLEKWADE